MYVPRAESRFLVLFGQSRSFRGDLVEGIKEERVYDVHGFLGDSDIGMDLLHYFVDVDREGFNSSLALSAGRRDCFFCLSLLFCHFNKILKRF